MLHNVYAILDILEMGQFHASNVRSTLSKIFTVMPPRARTVLLIVEPMAPRAQISQLLAFVMPGTMAAEPQVVWLALVEHTKALLGYRGVAHAAPVLIKMRLAKLIAFHVSQVPLHRFLADHRAVHVRPGDSRIELGPLFVNLVQ